MINYDGRRFRKVTSDPDAPVATYHQRDDLVWAEFAGGEVRRGSLTGTCAPDGTIDFAYTMVLAGGAVISGHSTNKPVFLPDGRIRLDDRWERYGAHAEQGTSSIVEVVG
ncbi:MAG TPA: hypothetical protein VFT95_19095 [Micromonosporaceae bacterium]|nr:hypothetical protein [Micromonosporaceae bacterium]